MTLPNPAPALTGVEAALRRAAARARALAQQTHTPLVTLKDGRIVRQIPGDATGTTSGRKPG